MSLHLGVHRLLPLGPLLAIILLALQSLTSSGPASAQSGVSAEEAIPISSGGLFGGMVRPRSSTFFRFGYVGGLQDATISITYLPVESSRTTLVLYTGSPQAPRREGSTADRADNVLTQVFTDPSARDVFVQVVNEHQDHSISFFGTITPESVLDAPPLPAPRAANTVDTAIEVQLDGTFGGTIAPRQLTWYRFYHGGGGVTSTTTATFIPSAANARVDLYTGPDIGHLNQQLDEPATTETTISRQVSLASPQWVYFTVSNSHSTALLAYMGQLSPIFSPLPAPAPVVPTPTPTPAPTPQPAPALVHDQRYFSETRFRIDEAPIWEFFQSRGQLETFGFPVSRTFTLLGCPVQVFQRQVVQICAGRLPALLNLLDPEIFPYTQVNGSTFPSVDEGLKSATPRVGDADYAAALLEFVRTNSMEMVDIDVWGAPISRPQADPGNANFVYQRFQRGVLHRINSEGVTRGILLADYLKAILRDRDVPNDLREQARQSRFLGQYCPGQPGWLCRPGELEATDLTFAFETG